MSNEDRLNQILKKQAAADADRDRTSQNEKAAELQRQSIRVQVTQVWRGKLLPAIENSVKKVNASLQGKRQLNTYHADLPPNAMRVDELTISFEMAAYPSLLSSKCQFAVDPGGTIYISFEGKTKTNKTFDAMSASEDDMESIIFDYWEQNI